MGCSSSSAQTVDQEKRPGTKPEESNGDTAGVRNDIIAEDAQTIEDQMQLPVQTALPDDLQPGTDDEAEAVLVALEAQEDLGSGEDLLAAMEPQPEPAAPEEPALEAPADAPAEVSTEAEAAVVAVEALTPGEEAAPVETVVTEATPEVKEESPAVDSVVLEQAEAPAFVEEVSVVPAEASPEPSTPAIEPVSEPAEVRVVVEEAATEVAEAPAEVSSPVEVEAETPLATPTESSDKASTGTQPAVTAPPAEGTCPTEVIPALAPQAESAAAESVQMAEASAPTPAISELPAEVAPQALPATVISECKVDNAAPAPVADPAPEASSSGATESKITKEG